MYYVKVLQIFGTGGEKVSGGRGREGGDHRIYGGHTHIFFIHYFLFDLNSGLFYALGKYG